MFGIGVGEFVVVAIVLLLAVGPDKMPTLFKTVGKTLRMFRRTTRELKNSIGLDELLRDDDHRRLRRPQYTPPPRKEPERYTLTSEDIEAEQPADGVDFSDARQRRQEEATDPSIGAETVASVGASEHEDIDGGGGFEGDYEDEPEPSSVDASGALLEKN